MTVGRGQAPPWHRASHDPVRALSHILKLSAYIIICRQRMSASRKVASSLRDGDSGVAGLEASLEAESPVRRSTARSDEFGVLASIASAGGSVARSSPSVAAVFSWLRAACVGVCTPTGRGACAAACDAITAAARRVEGGWLHEFLGGHGISMMYQVLGGSPTGDAFVIRALGAVARCRVGGRRIVDAVPVDDGLGGTGSSRLGPAVELALKCSPDAEAAAVACGAAAICESAAFVGSAESRGSFVAICNSLSGTVFSAGPGRSAASAALIGAAAFDLVVVMAAHARQAGARRVGGAPEGSGEDFDAAALALFARLEPVGSRSMYNDMDAVFVHPTTGAKFFVGNEV